MRQQKDTVYNEVFVERIHFLEPLVALEGTLAASPLLGISVGALVGATSCALLTCEQSQFVVAIDEFCKLNELPLNDGDVGELSLE